MRRGLAVALILVALAVGLVGGALAHRTFSLRPCIVYPPGDPYGLYRASPSSQPLRAGVRISGRCVLKR